MKYRRCFRKILSLTVISSIAVFGYVSTVFSEDHPLSTVYRFTADKELGEAWTEGLSEFVMDELQKHNVPLIERDLLSIVLEEKKLQAMSGGGNSNNILRTLPRAKNIYKGFLHQLSENTFSLSITVVDAEQGVTLRQASHVFRTDQETLKTAATQVVNDLLASSKSADNVVVRTSDSAPLTERPAAAQQFYRGLLALLNGEPYRAVPALRQAQRLDPQFSVAGSWEALAYEQLGLKDMVSAVQETWSKKSVEDVKTRGSLWPDGRPLVILSFEDAALAHSPELMSSFGVALQERGMRILDPRTISELSIEKDLSLSQAYSAWPHLKDGGWISADFLIRIAGTDVPQAKIYSVRGAKQLGAVTLRQGESGGTTLARRLIETPLDGSTSTQAGPEAPPFKMCDDLPEGEIYDSLTVGHDLIQLHGNETAWSYVILYWSCHPKSLESGTVHALASFYHQEALEGNLNFLRAFSKSEPTPEWPQSTYSEVLISSYETAPQVSMIQEVGLLSDTEREQFEAISTASKETVAGKSRKLLQELINKIRNFKKNKSCAFDGTQTFEMRQFFENGVRWTLPTGNFAVLCEGDPSWGIRTPQLTWLTHNIATHEPGRAKALLAMVKDLDHLVSRDTSLSLHVSIGDYDGAKKIADLWLSEATFDEKIQYAVPCIAELIEMTEGWAARARFLEAQRSLITPNHLKHEVERALLRLDLSTAWAYLRSGQNAKADRLFQEIASGQSRISPMGLNNSRLHEAVGKYYSALFAIHEKDLIKARNILTELADHIDPESYEPFSSATATLQSDASCGRPLVAWVRKVLEDLQSDDFETTDVRPGAVGIGGYNYMNYRVLLQPAFNPPLPESPANPCQWKHSIFDCPKAPMMSMP